MAITGNDLLKKLRGSTKEDEKDKEKTSSKLTGEDLLNRRKAYQTADTSGVDQKYIDSFIKDSNAFLTTAEKDHGGLGWGNASSAYESRNTTWQDLNTRANNISAWLYKNRDSIDREAYDSLSTSLEDIRRSGSSVLDAFKNSADYFAQWQSEDEYNKWYEAESDYQKHFENVDAGKASQGWQKYLADEEAAKNAPKYDLNNDGKDSWWETALGYLGGNGGGVTDTTLPTAGVTQTIHDLRADESYKRPSADWSEEQKNAFGALYATSPDLAYAFADQTNNRNAKAKEEEALRKIVESATSSFGAGAGHTLGALVTAPMGLADYLNDLAMVNAGRDIAPDGNISPFEYSQAVTGGIGEHLNKEFGTLDDDLWVVGGKGVGDLYGLGTSIAQSMASAYTLGPGGALVSYFGQGAAAGVDEALARGATDWQAALYGTSLGAFEGIAESIGIDNLFKLGTSTTIKGYLKNILKQAGAEGMEEGLTALLSNIADNAIMQDKSNFTFLVAQYMAQGMSESEATTKAWLTTIGDVAFDTIAGATSGGISGGIHTTAQNIASNIDAKKMYGDGADLVTEAMDIDPTNAFAKKMQARVDSGKSLSGSQINRLVESNEQTLKTQDKSKMKSAVEARLTELGETGDLGKIADVIVKAQTGGKLTSAERSVLVNSKYGRRVSTELNPQSIASGEYTSKWAENIGTERINVEAYNRDLYHLAEEQAGVSPVAEEGVTPTKYAPAKEIATESKFEASTDGKTKIGDTEVTIKEIASVKNGEMILRLEDGSTVNANDVEYGSSDEALLYENVLHMGLNAATANAFINGYDGSMPVAEYALGFREAYIYGEYGFPAQQMTSNGFSAKLPEAQRTLAYGLGKTDAKYKISQQQAATTKNSAKDSKKTKAKGKVHYDGVTKGLTERQQTSIKGLETIAEALGLDIYLFESEVNEKGQRKGANGWYDPNDGSIHIDVYAGLKGEGTILFTAAHELTHFIRQWSPAKFKVFADFLLEQYGQKGISVDALVRNQIEKAKRKDRIIDFDTAYEEVIADSCEMMLADGEVIQKLAELKAKDKSLWEKIKSFIADLVAKIKAVYEGLSPDSIEGRYVAEMLDTATNLKTMFTDALVDAGETYSEVRNALGKGSTIEVNEKGEFTVGKTQDGTLLYNDRTYDEGGRETLKATLEAEGYSAEDIDAALAVLDAKHDLVKRLGKVYTQQDIANNATLTTDLKNGLAVLSAIVSNGDYPVNIDLSMVCKKRIAYQQVINRLCESGLIKKAVLDSLAIAEINKILGKYGFETACLGCFVESRRIRIQEWAETICKEWNGIVDKMVGKGNAKEFGFAKETFVKDLSNDEVQTLSAELDSAYEREGLNYGRATVVKKMEQLLREVPSLRKHLTVADLITPTGRTHIKSLSAELNSLIACRYGSNTPKIVQDFNPYNHELAQYGKVPKGYDSLRDYLYAIGGARMQSFSDFIVENWFDYCQIVADLAARKLPMHTYTKEISLAKLFGMTGIKVNMSLIPDIDRSLGKEYAGLTKNAKGEYELIFADKDRFKATGGKSYMQSINFADAVALQNDPRYSSNVGTIAVGISDKHIRMMLGDSRIRMVIPYHSSGMNPIFAHLVGTDYYNDYTNVQNTGVAYLIDSKGNKQNLKLDKTQKGKLTSGFEFNAVLQELGDARETAKAYLDWCADASKHTITINGETYTAVLTPKFAQFSTGEGSENYYKLLEDFNTYDSITEQAAPQGDVQQIYPEDFDSILEAEIRSRDNYRKKQAPKWETAMGEIEGYLKTHKKADTIAYAKEHGIKLSKKDMKLSDRDTSTPKPRSAQAQRDEGYMLSESKFYQLYSAHKLDFGKRFGDVEPQIEAIKRDGFISSTSIANVLPTSTMRHFYYDRDGKVRFSNVVQATYAPKKGDYILFVPSNYVTKDDIIKNGFKPLDYEIGVVEYDYQPYYEVYKKAYGQASEQTHDGKVLYSDRDNGWTGKDKFFISVLEALNNPDESDAQQSNSANEAKTSIEEANPTAVNRAKGLYRRIMDGLSAEFREKAPTFDEWLADTEGGHLTNKTETKLSRIIYDNFKPRMNAPGYLKAREEQRALQNLIFELHDLRTDISDAENNDIRYSDRDSYAPTFYSHMGKVIDDIKLAKMGAGGVVSYLKGKGVKNEEIKWSGIEAFLEGKKSVTKAELQEFVAGSQLQIEETTLDNRELPMSQERSNRIAELETERSEIVEHLKSEWKRIVGTDIPISNFGAGLESVVSTKLVETDAKMKGETDAGRRYTEVQNALKQCIEDNDDFGYDNTRQAYAAAVRNPEDFLSSYELSASEEQIFRDLIEAKKAYQEAVGIPVQDRRALLSIAEKSDRLSRKISDVKSEHYADEAKYQTKWKQYRIDGGSNYRELVFKIPNSTYSNNAMAVHWGDEAEGILAHARLQDITTKDGKNMLFIEEIQSDWHNAGAKKGYVDKTKMLRVSNTEMRLENGWYNLYHNGRDLHQSVSEAYLNRRFPNGISESDIHDGLVKEYNKSISRKNGEELVPDAPFRTTYHEYVIKRLLRMAAEEGYDSLGWTPADIQSERWSDEYEEGYRIEYDQDIPKFLRKYGKKWGATVGKTTLQGVETKEIYYDVNRMDSYGSREAWENEVLSNLVAQGMPRNDVRSVKFREEGDYLIAYGKDGTEYDRAEIRRSGDSVWSMDIPDSMRDSVLHEGQVLYSDRVTDKETLDFLNEQLENGEVTKVYRAMQAQPVDENGNVIKAAVMRVVSQDPLMVEAKTFGKNGKVAVYPAKLFSPMAGMVNGKWSKSIDLNEWEETTFDLAHATTVIDKKTGKPKIDNDKKNASYGEIAYFYGLVKGGIDDDGKKLTDVPARYNPYIHTSLSALNDQFSSANKRPELVTVECIIPNSELTSGFRAEGAKDRVGAMSWHSGPTSSRLAKVGKARTVILTRYDMPVRVLPDSEVAKAVADYIGDTENIAIQGSTVTPSLSRELMNLGISVLNEEQWSRYSEDFPVKTFGGNKKYSDRDTSSVSNRSLLANALESVAQNDIERNKLKEYKGKIALIESEQAKLAETKAKIKELSFAKGRRDTEAIKKLQFEANQTANRINTYDRQLLNLEATAALKGVLQREKQLAYKKAEKEGQEALARYREKAAKTQRELLTRYQESRKKGVEGRRKTEMRHKIKNVVNELNQYLLKGTKEKHVPIELQKAVAEALDAVNMDTVNAEERIAKKRDEMLKAKTPEAIEKLAKEIANIREMGGNMANKISSLKTAYDSIINSDDPLIANSHDAVISNSIDKVVEVIGDTPLRDMSLFQLEAVYDLYKMVLKTIQNTNKAFKAEKGESIAIIANGVIAELEEKKRKSPYSTKAGQAMSEFDWNNQKPVYAFERIGSANFTKVFNAVRAGEDVWATDMNEAQAFREEQFKKYKYDSWDFKKRYRFTSTSGKSFELSLDQILSLYAFSKRAQAGDHLKYGGFVFDGLSEVKVKNKVGMSVTYQLKDATAYNLSEETLAEIIDKLTPEQKEFADTMQDYLSTVMGEKGNEVSLELYDIKLFKEKFYFPLKSAPQYMAKAKEQAQGEVKIKNSGFTKETSPKAKNPIVLSSFMDVWAGHVNEMSMYHAFTLPLEDFYRVYNYHTPADEKMSEMSVGSSLENAHGQAAVKYIDQLLKDLNGGARSDPRETVGKSLISKFKKASVMASMSVVVQQPTAIVRAMAVVNSKYFLGKPLKKKHKDAWAEVKKYAPVAVIKEMGYFDTGMGKGSVEWLKGEKTFMDKVDDATSKLPALADEATWVAIWNAVKRETVHTHKHLAPNSDAFLKAVGERFTEVITKTQVYDSTLSRSANMRSKSTFMNMVTSFMAEPTTSINMLQDAFHKGNKKRIARTMAAVYGSVILNSALVSLVYAMRDDDEDETFLEKYLSRFTTEVIDGVNPLTYLPFVKDIWSIAQGFDVERADMSLISDLIGSFQQATKVFSKDTSDMDDDELDGHKKDVAESILGIMDNFSSLAGIPVKNLRRDINGAINAFKTIGTDLDGRETTAGSLGDVIGGDVKDSIPVWGWFPDESKGDKLYDAIINGDTDYVERLKGGYKSEESYHSAVKKIVRERYEDGDLSATEAERMLVNHAGETEEDAYSKVQYWAFKMDYPDYDLSEEAVAKYYTDVEPSGISMDVYYDYYKQKAQCKGTDDDGDGRADSGTKKAAIMEVIDSLPITDEQKDALYYLNGWSESTLWQAPWH